MMRIWGFIIALMGAVPVIAAAVEPARYDGPVIDVHLHAAGADANGAPPTAACVGVAADLRYDQRTSWWPEEFTRRLKAPACVKPISGPATDDEVISETVAAMRRHKVTGFLGSDQAGFAKWNARGPGLFKPAREFMLGEPTTPDQLAAQFKAGEFAMLGEVMNQYLGSMASDEAFAPYLKMAADNDIPVGIHIGPGPPGTTARFPEYRAQSPLSLQQALTSHPKLRVFVMHAGYPFADDMKAMLYMFPGLYVDTGVLQMALTRAEYHRYLRELVEAGFGDRIMFGSDQMNWAGMIGEGIAAINDAPFLTYTQKKAILHDNAVRFFRLDRK